MVPVLEDKREAIPAITHVDGWVAVIKHRTELT
jgi:hypothetical protein